jgi:hypothetical protein
MNDLATYGDIPVAELRDKVMDELVKQYSLERVSLEEFERRTDLVSKAATRGEIIGQVADLPPLPAEAAEPSPARRARPAPSGQGRWRIDPDGGRPQDLSLAVFGGSDYKGVWRAPRQLTAICLFGGSKIDLREAIVPPEGVRISCLCLFGGVDVIAPPGMRVATHGAGIFGGFDRRDNEPEDRDAPTVTVEGLAFFGGVSVKVRP